MNLREVDLDKDQKLAIIEHVFYSMVLNLMPRRNMELDQLGIALSCHCGAYMSASIAGVLFGDKGRIKISGAPIHCSACGAIYHRGERLRYRLLSSNGLSGKKMKILSQGNGHLHSSKKHKITLGSPAPP